MVYVVYYSGTGNTEAMANAVGEGINAAGGEAKVVSVTDLSASELKDQAVFALGCPAMGAEELEEGDMEPFVSEVEGFASGKKIALFGSYDWGDGEWMRTWAERMTNAGAVLVADPVIANNTPEEDDLQNCKALGEALAKA